MFQRFILLGSISALLSGCGISATSVYPGTGLTFDLREDGVQTLGEVTACQGAFCKNDATGRTEWPMSLTVPPPAATYHAAIRKNAVRIYNVPEDQIVIGEVKVGYYTEVVGTIRGWTATAPVGRRTAVTRSERLESGSATKTDTVPDRLRLLDDLRRQGLITDSEYNTKRSKILNDSLGQ
jgi:hypothetical protein